MRRSEPQHLQPHRLRLYKRRMPSISSLSFLSLDRRLFNMSLCSVMSPQPHTFALPMREPSSRSRPIVPIHVEYKSSPASRHEQHPAAQIHMPRRPMQQRNSVAENRRPNSPSSMLDSRSLTEAGLENKIREVFESKTPEHLQPQPSKSGSLACVTNHDPIAQPRGTLPEDQKASIGHRPQSIWARDRSNSSGQQTAKWTEYEDDLVRSYHDLPEIPTSTSYLTLYETPTVKFRRQPAFSTSNDKGGTRGTKPSVVQWKVPHAPGGLVSTAEEQRRMAAAIKLDFSLLMDRCAQIQSEYCRKRYKSARELPNGYIVSLLNPCWDDLEHQWGIRYIPKRDVKRGKSYTKRLSEVENVKTPRKYQYEMPLRVAVLERALFDACQSFSEAEDIPASSSESQDHGDSF